MSSKKESCHARHQVIGGSSSRARTIERELKEVVSRVNEEPHEMGHERLYFGNGPQEFLTLVMLDEEIPRCLSFVSFFCDILHAKR